MKRTRMLSILLAVLLVFSFSAAALAAEPMTVTVETKTDAASAGEEVTLAVSVAGNPGFTNFKWTLEYDDASLELKNVENKLNGYLVTREEEGKAVIGIITAEPVSQDGAAFLVTFVVKQNAVKGLSEVKIIGNELASLDKTIDAHYVSGGVTIAESMGGTGSTTGGTGSTTGGTGSTTGGTGSTTGGTGSTTDSDRKVELVGKSNGATHKITGNTLNVRNDVACVVLWTVDNGKTYTKLTAAMNETAGYDFDLRGVPAKAVIKIAVKGDVDGDGAVSVFDRLAVAAYLLPSSNENHEDLTTLAFAIADCGGDGVVDVFDRLAIAAALLPTGNGNHEDLTW